MVTRCLARRPESMINMIGKNKPFDAWLGEWIKFAMSREGGREPRHTADEVSARALAYQGGDEVTGLGGLAAAATALSAQRERLQRCRVFLGREVTRLHDAGGRWSDIAVYGGLGDSTVRTLEKAFLKGPAPGDDGFDRELHELANAAPSNPFWRVHELVGAWDFHSRIADELQDLLNRLCIELHDAGAPAGQIARHAGISSATLAKRVEDAEWGMLSGVPGLIAAREDD